MGKITERFYAYKLFERIKERLGDGFKDPLPFTAVVTVQLQPAVEHGRGDGKPLTQGTYSPQPHTVFGYDPQDEEETVRIVGDYGIRKDSVGMTA